MTPLRLTFSVFTILGLAVLAAGYLGRWWPPGDSLAVGRVQVLVAALPVLAALWWSGGRRLAGLGFALCLLSGAQTAWVTVAPCRDCTGGPVVVTLYQKNLLFTGPDHAALVADIIDSGADLVTLQEVSERNLVILDDLRGTFPHQHFCSSSGVGGTVILSRLPLGAQRCPSVRGLALAEITLAQGEVYTVASLHLHWPWPFGQAVQVAAVRAALGDPDRLLLAGDFNMQPWGWAVRGLPGARVGGYGATFPRFLPWAPLIIDHIKARGLTGRAALRPLFGSDHHGVLARLWLRAD